MADLHYVDTSAIVPAFVHEPATDRILAWLSSQPDGGMAISPWVAAEFARALSLKARSGVLGRGTHAAAMAQWRRFVGEARILEIERRHFEQASLLCERSELKLRAGDALHLAVAATHGYALVTLDERMAKAAPEVGVPVVAI